MPFTYKQKSKARKSSEAEMLSDFENMDIMLGSNHFEREESEFGNTTRRPESPSYDAIVDHNTNSHSNSIQVKMKSGGLPMNRDKLILVAR